MSAVRQHAIFATLSYGVSERVRSDTLRVREKKFAPVNDCGLIPKVTMRIAHYGSPFFCRDGSCPGGGEAVAVAEVVHDGEGGVGAKGFAQEGDVAAQGVVL